MRIKKRITWLFTFLVLGLFSVYSLAGITGLGTNTAYAATLAKNDFHKRGHHFMVVDKPGKQGGLGAAMNNEQEVCVLNSVQVAQLDAFFKVDTFELDINGNVVEIATVSGKRLTKHQLLQYLRATDASLDCRIVQHHRVFFFPVVPQVS